MTVPVRKGILEEWETIQLASIAGIFCYKNLEKLAKGSHQVVAIDCGISGQGITEELGVQIGGGGGCTCK
jgi:hypothetical protein